MAEVKAFVTGTDIKSTTKPFVLLELRYCCMYGMNNCIPNLRTPISSSMQPAKNAKIIAYCGGLSKVYCKVSSDISEVGPIETSLIVPKNT